jgi:hypothetical protein
MRVSSFAVSAEIFLHLTEYNNIHDVLIKHKIMGCFWYVDALFTYNEELTDVNLILQKFKNTRLK